MSVKTHLAIEANKLSIKYASMEQLGKPGTASSGSMCVNHFLSL
jgi:hypothetical protein